MFRRLTTAQQRKEDLAEASLRRLRNKSVGELEFRAEFNEIRQLTREQLEQNNKALFLEMWQGTNLRRTLLSIAVGCFPSANGYFLISPWPWQRLTTYRSSWVNKYTTYFLQVAGIKEPFSYSVLVTCTGLIGVLVSLFFVRRIDQRTVMLVGTTACAICQLVPAIAWSKSPGNEGDRKGCNRAVHFFLRELW